MAPGCFSVVQQESWSPSNESLSFANNQLYLDQIPLPSTPPPAIIQQKSSKSSILPLQKSQSVDTIDSFEVLEQTVMKQKKLSRKKNNDMRMKVLLKRTFDLICEIMDHENGFDTAEEDKISTQPPNPVVQDFTIDDSQFLEISIHQNDYEDETSVITTTDNESSLLDSDDRIPSIETLKNIDTNSLESDYYTSYVVQCDENKDSLLVPSSPTDNKKRKCDDFYEHDDFDYSGYSFCEKKQKFSFDDENEMPDNSDSTPMFHNLTNVKHDLPFKRRIHSNFNNNNNTASDQYHTSFDCRLESHLKNNTNHPSLYQKQIIINFQSNTEL